jgi:hypothetical protein
MARAIDPLSHHRSLTTNEFSGSHSGQSLCGAFGRSVALGFGGAIDPLNHHHRSKTH